MWTPPSTNQTRKNRPVNQRRKEQVEKDAASKGSGRWSRVKVRMPFQEDSALKHVPFLVFLTLLGIVYIANSHYSEAKSGQITKLERKVKDLQMEYGTLKYEYMTASDKEEVARRLEQMGLVPNDEHITKIKLSREAE